jgi:hypothetical protein
MLTKFCFRKRNFGVYFLDTTPHRNVYTFCTSVIPKRIISLHVTNTCIFHALCTYVSYDSKKTAIISLNDVTMLVFVMVRHILYKIETVFHKLVG